MVDRCRSISPPAQGLEAGEGFANRCLTLRTWVVQDGTLQRIPREVPYQAMLPWTLVPHGSNKMPFCRSNSGESVVVRKAPQIRCQAGSLLRGLPGW
jgi:hypothetical protein